MVRGKKNLFANLIFSLFWVSVLPVMFIICTIMQIMDVAVLPMHTILREKTQTHLMCDIFPECNNMDALLCSRDKSDVATKSHSTFSDVLACLVGVLPKKWISRVPLTQKWIIIWMAKMGANMNHLCFDVLFKKLILSFFRKEEHRCVTLVRSLSSNVLATAGVKLIKWS